MTALAAVLALAASQLQILDEGTKLGRKLELDLTGAGVTCVSTSTNRATCTITSGGGGGAPTTATYIVQTPDATLSNEFALSTLGTGILRVTTGTGALSSAAADINITGFTLTATTVKGTTFRTTAPAGLTDVRGNDTNGGGVFGTVAGNTNALSLPGSGQHLLHIYNGGTSAAFTSIGGGYGIMSTETGSDITVGIYKDGSNNLTLKDGTGTRTLTSIPTAYTLPALTASALGGVKGTGASLTCSGTDKATGFDAAGALQCGTDQTSATSAYATVQDEGVALTQRPTVNFIGSAITCVDNSGATRTDCTVTGGGGGSPGGSSGQVQYNSSSTFAGISNVTSDGTDFVFIGRTTEPAAPAAGSLKFWAMQPHGSGAPVLPYWKGGTTQVDYRLFPEVLSTDPVWGCIQPAAHGSTTLTVSGSMQAGGATGTAAAVAWASTDARTRAKWVQYPTTAAVNLNAGYRANTDYVWRGSAAGLGGFYVWGSMTIVTGNAGQRVFMGLKDATAVLTAASDPNAALDTVYFGANAADTNLSICSNDNAGTATCTTLGASFPAKTANQAYDVAFWAAPNGSSIGYAITNVVSGANATGTVSTDLPRNTVQLGFDFNINSGTGAVITTMQFGGTCYIANP